MARPHRCRPFAPARCSTTIALLILNAERPKSRTAAEAINSYITDMLALEAHIVTAVQGQQKDLKDEHPQFSAVLREEETFAMRHSNELNGLVDERKIGAGGIAEAFKKAGAVVLGVGAAAIDLVRTERVPKNLRDDYTVIALATVGYAMLFKTAKSLKDERVATLAAAQHKDDAKASMALHHVVPASVVALLAEEGLTVDASVLQDVNKELDTHGRQ